MTAEWVVGFRRPLRRPQPNATVWITIQADSSEDAATRAAAVIAQRYPGKTFLLSTPPYLPAKWREMGAEACRNGERRVPAQSKALIAALRGEPSINAALTEWLKGWDAENLQSRGPA